jgi:hypothetical protein
MASRQQRLDDFNGSGTPRGGEACELLCEDHCGTYVVPFPCSWVNDGWRSMKSGAAIEATVIGWRKADASAGKQTSHQGPWN